MKILIIIASLIIAIGFLSIRSNKLPESISSIVYKIPNKFKFIWTLWIWIISFLTMIPLLDSMEGSQWLFIGFFTMISLGFCGALPLIKDEKNIAHNILGLTSGILSLFCVVIICPWLISIWVLLGLGVIIKNKKLNKLYNSIIKGNEILFLELLSIVILYTSILLS